MSLPRMSDAELREFVLGVCDDKVFTSAHLQQREGGLDLLRMVFLPLALGAMKEAPEAHIKDVGLMWEWMREAGPRSINGYPMFFSVRFMHQLDWERALPAIKAELKRREELPI
jgi:hypothetical protein